MEQLDKPVDYLDEVAEPLDEQASMRDLLIDRRGPGRPRGAKNISRPGFREMTYDVLNSIEMGGLQGYIEWAMKHKTDFYSRLCAKLFGGEFILAQKVPMSGGITFVLSVPPKAIDQAVPEGEGHTHEPDPTPLSAMLHAQKPT